MANGLDRLSSSEVVAALQELTGVLRPTLSEDQQAAVTSNDEAWLAVMAIAGLDATQIPADIQPERSLAAARALLAIAAADPELGAEFFHRILRVVAGRVKATEIRFAEMCGIKV